MPMVLLRAGDDRSAPLVCVHPVTGRGDVYRALADVMDWPGPVFGIDAPAPPPPLPDDQGYRLDELASRYVDELDLRMPPLLLGWSLGGVIAAEMSRVIAERGSTVRFLGVIDSRAPQPEMRQRPADRDTLSRAFLQNAALSRELEPPAPLASSRVSDLQTALLALGDIANDEEVERRLQIFMGLVRGLYRHVAQPVPVTLHLFESAEAHPSHPRPPTLGWEALAPRLERRVVAGTHFSLLAPQRIAALAATIGKEIPR